MGHTGVAKGYRLLSSFRVITGERQVLISAENVRRYPPRMVKTLPKTEGLLGLYPPVHSPTLREVRAGAEAETMREPLCPGLLTSLSKATSDHLPGGGTTHTGLGFSTPIINHDSVLQTGPQPNLMEAFFSGGSCSPEPPVYVEWRK